ncbi:hypothetical protein ACEE90_03430 [Corynebacterium phoceense]
MSINLDALLEKRREVVGDAHKFPVEFQGKTFHFVAPEIASSEWNDKRNQLNDDYEDGIISAESMRDETLALILEDEAEDFRATADAAGVDPLTLLGMAMQDHADHVGKIRARQNSNRSQRRAKQR